MAAREAPDIDGLKRRDAVLLIAVSARRPKQQPARGLRRLWWFIRLYVLMRFSLRRRVSRLEERGFIEPGWNFAWRVDRAVVPAVTPLGKRAAAVAAAMFELEDYAGPL